MVKKPFSNITGGQKSQPILPDCLTAIDLRKQQRQIFISPHSTLSTMRGFKIYQLLNATLLIENLQIIDSRLGCSCA
jgi:hypothetical protein